MYVSINKKGEIKSVGVSTDPALTTVFIDDVNSPFIGWSNAKICCYKVTVKDGIVYMMTPYIDSRLIEHFDSLGIANEENESSIDETNVGLMETYEDTLTNSTDINNLELAVEELYEMITTA